MIKKSILFTIFLVISSFANITISTDTTLSGIIEVKDSGLHFDSCSVTILPGTIFKVDSGLGILFRDCNIYAEGTPSDSIIFTASDTNGTWGELNISNSKTLNNTVKIKYAIFEKMYELRSWSLTSMSISSNNLDMSDCVIRKCTGIYALGIHSGTIFQNCILSENRGGIKAFDSTKILNCKFFNNRGAGISVDGRNVEINNCEVKKSFNYGIYVFKTPTIIKNSTVYGTDGCGIYLDDYEQKGPLYIDSCLLDSNINDRSDKGGGFSHDDEDSVQFHITNTTFTRNNSEDNGGGLLSIRAMKGIIENCTFLENKAWRRGSDIYIGGADSMLIQNNSFSKNDGYGSAITIFTDTISSKVNHIKKNTFTNCSNGAIDFEGINQILIDSCTFIDNYDDYCDIKAKGVPIIKNITWTDSTFNSNRTNLGTKILSSDETWSGTVTLPEGGLYVEHGVTLTIQSGTKILGSHTASGLAIGGVLIANGSPTDSITFTSDSANSISRWRGINFLQGPNRDQRSIISYAHVSKGRKDLGGGIYCGKLVDLTIKNSTITDNRTSALRSSGGGICIEDAPAIIDSCTITNNESYSYHRNGFTYGLGSRGGGIYAENKSSDKLLIISNCSIRDNLAETDWYSSYGGGAYIIGDSKKQNIKMLNCTVIKNSVEVTDSYFGDHALGGGIYSSNAKLDLITIDSCYARGPGKKSFGIQALSTEINRSFLSESVTITGENVKLSNSVIPSFISFTDAQGVMTNCTSTKKNPIYISNKSTIKMYNTIHKGSINVDSMSTIDISHCILDDSSSYLGINNNVSGTVLYEDSSANNFQLLEGSIGIDMGIEDTTGTFVGQADFISHKRVFGDRIDIGAYEYGSTEIVANNQKNITSINTEEKIRFTISPHNYIFLTLPTNMKSKDINFRIFNLKGQVITKLNKPSNQLKRHLTIDLNELAKGIYILNISGNSIMFNQKITIR